jgi:hypothetical protein
MSFAEPAGAASRVSSLPLLPIGIAAGVLHALAMIPGYNDNGSFDTTAWLVMAAVSVVLGAALFLFVVPKGGSTTALVLSILAFVTLAAFWMMLSLPLAAAALVTAMRARDRGEANAKTTVALVLGGIAVVGLVAIIIGDASSS